jgi:hypothetical protein
MCQVGKIEIPGLGVVDDEITDQDVHAYTCQDKLDERDDPERLGSKSSLDVDYLTTGLNEFERSKSELGA